MGRGEGRQRWRLALWTLGWDAVFAAAGAGGVIPWPATAFMAGFFALLAVAFGVTERRQEKRARSELPAAPRKREPAVLPPARQVLELGEQYGLPVVTELKKAALPLVAAPLVTGTGPGARAAGSAYQERLAEEARMLEAARDPGPSPQAQAELSAVLLADMRAQAAEAKAAGDPGYPGTHVWQMNAEWRAEALRLTDAQGRRIWEPGAKPSTGRSYTLLGYCVAQGSEEYGAPSLVPGPAPAAGQPYAVVRSSWPGHACQGRYYAAPRYCPVHGRTRLTDAERALQELRHARDQVWAEARRAVEAGVPSGMLLTRVSRLDRRIREQAAVVARLKEADG